MSRRSETSISWRKMIAGWCGGADGDGKRRLSRCDRAEDMRADVSGSMKSIFQVTRTNLWRLVMDGEEGEEGVEASVEGSQMLRSAKNVK